MTAAAVISTADLERKQNNERRLSPRRFVEDTETSNFVRIIRSNRRWTFQSYKFSSHTQNQFPHKCSLYFVCLHCHSIRWHGFSNNTNAGRATAAMQGVAFPFFLLKGKCTIVNFPHFSQLVLKSGHLFTPYKQPLLHPAPRTAPFQCRQASPLQSRTWQGPERKEVWWLVIGEPQNKTWTIDHFPLATVTGKLKRNTFNV